MDLQKFPKAYEILSVKENHFEFTTDSLITYSVYAIPGKEIVPDFIFSRYIWYVGFYPIPSTIAYDDLAKYTYDEKIMNTIFNFIISIMEEKDNIVAFNYSPERGRQSSRERLFNIQYVRHGKKATHKMNFKLEGEDSVTIIFRKDNINFAAICTITGEDIIRSIEDK